MGKSPITRPTLLLRIRNDADGGSWSQFVELYSPLVYGFLRKRGLQDADAADLTQDVMLSVARAIHSFEYEPVRGSFRRWLFTIVQNRLFNFWKRQGPPGSLAAGGTPAYEILAEHPQKESEQVADWDEAYDRQLFQYAAEQVRCDFKESTWLAFWRTAVDGDPAKEVAEALDVSVAAVYMAKRRVIARIQEQIAFLQGDSE